MTGINKRDLISDIKYLGIILIYPIAPNNT